MIATIIDSPYSFCFAWFLINTAIGIMIGRSFYSWRVKRLLARIELLKLEIGVHHR